VTAEQNVKRFYPKAHAVFTIRAITIVADDEDRVLGERLGFNRSETQAWSAAWHAIQKERRKLAEKGEAGQ
jgi:hypothetical protein